MNKVYIKDQQDNKVLPYTHVSAVLDDEGNDLSSHLGAFEDEVRGLVETPHQEYVTVATYSALPASGSEDTIYRVSSWDGSANSGAGAVDVTVYSEYAWNGSDYVFLCVKSQIDEVFDITVYNSNTKYADLSAALGVNGVNIPESLRKGGMSVKYVQSSDKNYYQWRLTAKEFTIDTSKWVAENEDFRNEVMQEVNEAIESITPIKISGDVTNAPDEEDLTSVNVSGTDVLKFKDKAYTPLIYSGMGRVYLRKNYINSVNTLTQDMFYKGEIGSRVPNTNSIFIIQYDYNLAGNEITIPEDCILIFDGGSFTGGILNVNKSTIYNGKFINTTININGRAIIKDSYFGSDNRDVIAIRMNASENSIIEGCTFNKCLYGIIAVTCNNSLIKSCVFTDNLYNIHIYVGSYNVITGNYIDGNNVSITGINFLASRHLKVGYCFVGNVISKNTIKGITEESISFDCHGNSPQSCAPYKNYTVRTITQSDGFSFIYVNETVAAGYGIGNGIIKPDGDNPQFIGICTNMGSGGNAGFRVANPKTLVDERLAANDKITLCILAINNIITDNTLYIAPTQSGGIVLWGMGVLNTISNNSISLNPTTTKIGIGIWLGAIAGVTGSNDNFDVGNYDNVICGNILQGCIIKSNLTDYRDSDTYRVANNGNIYENNKQAGEPILNGEITKNHIGYTSNRPTLYSYDANFEYFDKTLGKPIWWNGSAWVDATGATV